MVIRPKKLPNLSQNYYISKFNMKRTLKTKEAEKIFKKNRMNSQILNKITIIVPTFNRPLFLLRLLKFYKSYGFSMKMLILDSSSDVLGQDELQDLLTNKKISYQKFNPDIYISQVHKITKGLKNILTPYSVVCADDDFIVPSAIEKCVVFLEKNPDYSVVQGLYCRHSLKRRKNGKVKFDWVPAYYNAKSLTSDNPSERLKFHLSNYNTPTFYGVHRTNTLRFLHRESLKTAFHGRMSEVLLTALTLIYGKMKILPIFYSSREPGTSSTEQTFKVLPYYYSRWPSFLAEDSYKLEYKKAVACLAKNFQKQTNFNINKSTEIAKEAFDGYLNPLRLRIAQRDRSHFRKPFKKILTNLHLLGSYKRMENIRTNIQLRPIKREYSKFLEKNDSRFQENLNRIKKAVIESEIYTI